MRNTLLLLCATIVITSGPSFASPDATTQPSTTTKPSSSTADATRERLDNMLQSTGRTARPLQPMDDAKRTTTDATSGNAGVAPDAPPVHLQREGSYLVDRVGRLVKTPDGQGWEFHFEADGRALRDPPVVVQPSLKLMLMEDQLKQTNRDLKFRVTGMLSEYRGRNYVMLDKVVIIGD